MNIARFFSQTFGYGIEKSGHIMVGFFQDLIHAFEINAGEFNFRDGGAGNHSQLRPGFTHRDFYLKPLAELVFL